MALHRERVHTTLVSRFYRRTAFMVSGYMVSAVNRRKTDYMR